MVKFERLKNEPDDIEVSYQTFPTKKRLSASSKPGLLEIEKLAKLRNRKLHFGKFSDLFLGNTLQLQWGVSNFIISNIKFSKCLILLTAGTISKNM